MRKPHPALVTTVLVPFMAACFGTTVQPLPETGIRPVEDVRGVVVGDSITGERVEFDRIDNLIWTESTVEFIGVLKGTGFDGPIVTRAFELREVSGLVVRELDANKTSLIVIAIGVGAGILAAFAFGGLTNSTTVFEDPGS